MTPSSWPSAPPLDNLLGIPGEDKAGVIGSAAFVGWYNGHPNFLDLAPDFSTDTVAVIGNGNVAIDIARLFSKTSEELLDSDISTAGATGFRRSKSPRRLHVRPARARRG